MLLYRQVRVGEGGRRFTIIKFRSMRTDAEAYGQRTWTGARPAHHPRRTFLRRCRIDELPQLGNVVRVR